jgi:hypothetical protein
MDDFHNSDKLSAHRIAQINVKLALIGWMEKVCDEQYRRWSSKWPLIESGKITIKISLKIEETLADGVWRHRPDNLWFGSRGRARWLKLRFSK